MGKFLVLQGCTVENVTDYLAQHLSESIEDYPDGIVIPVDKPYRWTSADVVRKFKFQIQKHFHQKNIKVGHAGTLDPLATGLLLICVGKATKVAEELQSHEKEYIARIEFGATTPSYDLEQPIDTFYPYDHINSALVKGALNGFLGEQEQVPPIFSAKIINGLRAYEYARAGESVELRKSLITIYEIEMLDFIEADSTVRGTGIIDEKIDFQSNEKPLYQTSSENSDGSRPSAILRIRCSKGTYIRSLARDLGLALNSGAYLTALRRIRSGVFGVEVRG